jgi:hypothetical protein
MYEVRFFWDGMKHGYISHKFSKKENAESYFEKVVSIMQREDKKGKVALLNKNWLDKSFEI